MKIYQTAKLVILLAVLLPSTGAFSQSAAVSAAPRADKLDAFAGPFSPSLLRHDEPYRLRSGDRLQLTFSRCPEFDQTLSVQPDGGLSLKEVGMMPVRGKTLAELSDAINVAYKDILREPHVAISLEAADIEKPYFIAAGQIVKPGRYDLTGRTTLFQAVAIAGGFTDSAKHSRVVVYRLTQDDGYAAKLIDVKQLLADHNLRADLVLQPGDLIYVPKSTFSKIKPFLPNTSLFLSPLAY